MQSARRVQSEETRLHLQDAHSRVMSIAMLQKQLAVTQLKSVELRTYFADLCRSISASMIDDPKRLTLETIVDDTTTNSDVSVSMGLIVTELVINAIKHAFPDRAAGGKVMVSFAADEEHGCCTYRIMERECRPARNAESRALAQGSSGPCRSSSTRE